MTNKLLTETSKFLSYVLRHEPQAIGLALDGEGWANLDVLIAAATRHGHRLDRALIEQVVSTNDKKRFAFSPDGSCIRAVQGHSTPDVSISFERSEPPPVLYHGTATRFLQSIRERGLLPGSRQYVHLSADMQTAVAVGRRYGTPVVLVIDAKALHAQGVSFFRAENGVWLVHQVPHHFIAPVTQ